MSTALAKFQDAHKILVEPDQDTSLTDGGQAYRASGTILTDAVEALLTYGRTLKVVRWKTLKLKGGIEVNGIEFVSIGKFFSFSKVPQKHFDECHDIADFIRTSKIANY